MYDWLALAWVSLFCVGFFGMINGKGRKVGSDKINGEIFALFVQSYSCRYVKWNLVLSL